MSGLLSAVASYAGSELITGAVDKGINALFGSNDKPTAADYGSMSRRQMRARRRMLQMEVPFMRKQNRIAARQSLLEDPGLIARGAKAAGINPLVLLGQGFGSSAGGLSAPGGVSVSPQNSQYAPGTTARFDVGEVLRSEAATEAQEDKAVAELAGVRADQAPSSAMIMSSAARGRIAPRPTDVAVIPGEGGEIALEPIDRIAPSNMGTEPAQVPLRILGQDFVPYAQTSDAESFEARYGEIGGEVAGATSMAVDVNENRVLQKAGWNWLTSDKLRYSRLIPLGHVEKAVKGGREMLQTPIDEKAAMPDWRRAQFN